MAQGNVTSGEGNPAVALPPITPAGWIAYQNTGTRVVLRPRAIDDLSQEAASLGCRRLMVVCGPRTRASPIYARVMTSLGGLAVHVLDAVVEHSSTTGVTEGARLAREHSIDGLIAVGGGSASDTAKGIAILLAEGGRIEDHASTFVPPDRFYPQELHHPKLPVISIPTTASGAEVTPGLGIRDEQGRKLLFWDVKLACRLIVIDPAANVCVPAAVMASTAMNGLAHCAEGLYSRLRNPVSEGLALQGIRMFARSLPAMVAEPDSVAHRTAVMGAAHISGMVISNARVGIHHAVCHCLGARGGLAHGVANSIMLPHALAYNVPVAAAELAGIAQAMGVDTRGLDDEEAAWAGIDAVKRLQLSTGVPTRLRDSGMPRDMIPAVARDTMLDRGLYFNPRRTEDVRAIIELLERAW